IRVREARMLASSLRRSGSRCTTTTKVAPVSAGSAEKNACNGRRPPAEAPMATTTGSSALKGVGLSSAVIGIHWSGVARIFLRLTHDNAPKHCSSVKIGQEPGPRPAVDLHGVPAMSNRDIVALGTSAGGVEALTFLARNMPEDFTAAILVTIHLPAYASSTL